MKTKKQLYLEKAGVKFGVTETHLHMNDPDLMEGIDLLLGDTHSVFGPEVDETTEAMLAHMAARGAYDVTGTIATAEGSATGEPYVTLTIQIMSPVDTDE